MCSYAAVGITMGLLQGVTGAMAAQQQTDYENAVAEQKYQVAKRNADRNNQISDQQYQNQLRIIDAKDKAKKRDYEAQLKSHEEAINANIKQTEINTIAANLAATKVSVDKRKANAKAAFDAEQALATMIQSQGELLSTGNAGQSFLLQTENFERTFGMESEKINENLFLDNLGFGLDMAHVYGDYYSAEARAYNKLPGTPQSEQASMLPFTPIKDPGPAKPIRRSSSAGVMSAVVGGVGAGFSAYGAAKQGNWFG